jgi:methionine-gamma-lyase
LAPLLDRASTHAAESAEAIKALGTREKFGDFYPRLGHRNGIEFESAVAELEGADGALGFSSGIAAIHAAVLGLCSAGDRVLIARQIYGGTSNLAKEILPRFGIEVIRFSSLDPEELESALQKPTKMVVVETPINPTLRIVDLRRIADLCRQAGAISMVDSTFGPPTQQRCLDFGIDLVMHSATKFLGGHSDVLAGVLAGSHQQLGPIEAFRVRTGGILSPDSAWLLSRSLHTLELRVQAQQDAAAHIAQGLQELASAGSTVRSVNYPGLAEHPDHALAREQMQGFGALVTFEIDGGLEAAMRCFDRLQLVARGPSLGSVESLASLPAYTTHAALSPEERAAEGIAEGHMRISVGLEGGERILADLRQALGLTNS